MKVLSPIKYPGGKTYLAARIVALMPNHTHYVEEYCGGCAVLFASTRPDRSEVVNDVDDRLTTFWRALADPRHGPDLVTLLSVTPFSQAEFNRAWALTNAPHELRDIRGIVDKARAYFIVNRQSLAGMGESFAPLSKLRTRSGINEQASAWLAAVAKLPEFVERLRSVVVLDDEATAVFAREDGSRTLHYMDPPYHPETVGGRNYKHAMTAEDHEKLLALITDEGVKGNVMISGYSHPSYTRWLSGWNRHVFKIDNKMAKGKEKPIKNECLWCNF